MFFIEVFPDTQIGIWTDLTCMATHEGMDEKPTSQEMLSETPSEMLHSPHSIYKLCPAISQLEAHMNIF